MITYEDLKKANDIIEEAKVDVKGKKYAMVNDRVKAFRMVCPNGAINTDIISLGDGIVTIKATVSDEEGRILGTGTAQEKESSSYINKTSFIENCETSAVGRALGFAGIGVDGSMASAEEVANAILNQGNKPVKEDPNRVLTIDEVKRLKTFCGKYNMPEEILAKHYKKKKLGELTKADWDDLYAGTGIKIAENFANENTKSENK